MYICYQLLKEFIPVTPYKVHLFVLSIFLKHCFYADLSLNWNSWLYTSDHIYTYSFHFSCLTFH